MSRRAYLVGILQVRLIYGGRPARRRRCEKLCRRRKAIRVRRIIGKHRTDDVASPGTSRTYSLSGGTSDSDVNSAGRRPASVASRCGGCGSAAARDSDENRILLAAVVASWTSAVGGWMLPGGVDALGGCKALAAHSLPAAQQGSTAGTRVIGGGSCVIPQTGICRAKPGSHPAQTIRACH